MTSQKDKIGAARGYSQCILRSQILGYFDLFGQPDPKLYIFKHSD